MFFISDFFGCRANIITNHDNIHILESMLKLFSLCMVQFGYEDNEYMMVVWVQCARYNRHVHCEISDSVIKYMIPVFIQSVFLSCLSFAVNPK